MSRKDYILLAKVIKETTINPETIDRQRFLEKLFEALLQDNPRFKPERFLQILESKEDLG
jgi:dGTP triphosphohydrolase